MGQAHRYLSSAFAQSGPCRPERFVRSLRRPKYRLRKVEMHQGKGVRRNRRRIVVHGRNTEVCDRHREAFNKSFATDPEHRMGAGKGRFG